MEVKPAFRIQKKCPIPKKFDHALEVYFLELP